MNNISEILEKYNIKDVNDIKSLRMIHRSRSKRRVQALQEALRYELSLGRNPRDVGREYNVRGDYVLEVCNYSTVNNEQDMEPRYMKSIIDRTAANVARKYGIDDKYLKSYDLETEFKDLTKSAVVKIRKARYEFIQTMYKEKCYALKDVADYMGMGSRKSAADILEDGPNAPRFINCYYSNKSFYTNRKYYNVTRQSRGRTKKAVVKDYSKEDKGYFKRLSKR